MEVGEFLSAGLNGEPLDAKPEPLEASPEPVELPETVRLGLLPARLDSVGFLDQENISLPGIFQPLLQPVCVPATAAITSANLVHFVICVRIACNSLWQHLYRVHGGGVLGNGLPFDPSTRIDPFIYQYRSSAIPGRIIHTIGKFCQIDIRTKLTNSRGRNMRTKVQKSI
jgi:hypothetical protein